MLFSIFDDIKKETGLPDAVFCLIAILLILLTSIVWVAFCVVLHKTVYRMAEYKRQQRRQQIISSAFALSAQEFPHLHGISPERVLSELSQLDPAIFINSQQYDYTSTELPSYDEALQLPSPNGAERINSVNNININTISEMSNTVTGTSHTDAQINDINNKEEYVQNEPVTTNNLQINVRQNNNSRNRTQGSLTSLPPSYSSLQNRDEL
uniref:Uncharacterized protein n=1 Tax=Parastrongyloides trichosuri TaxID=131310 RepID=A0A0N4ZAC7_PARTI